jgi:hypothetical protein
MAMIARRPRFKLVGDDARREEENASVVGWNDRLSYQQRIRNYTARPINVEIRRPYEGHVTFVSQLEPKLHDYQTVELTAQVEPGAKKNLDFTVVQHLGRNAKQNNVTLEASGRQRMIAWSNDRLSATSPALVDSPADLQREIWLPARLLVNTISSGSLRSDSFATSNGREAGLSLG